MGGEQDRDDVTTESLDESAEIHDDDVVILVDEDGGEHPFVIMALVAHEGVDYALLAPEDQLVDEGGEEDGVTELFILRYDQDAEGNELFSPVEDEVAYDEVKAACAELFDIGFEE